MQATVPPSTGSDNITEEDTMLLEASCKIEDHPLLSLIEGSDKKCRADLKSEHGHLDDLLDSAVVVLSLLEPFQGLLLTLDPCQVCHLVLSFDFMLVA